MWKYLLPLLFAVTVEGQTLILLPQSPLDPAETTELELRSGDLVSHRRVPLTAHELSLGLEGVRPWTVRCLDPSLWCFDLLLGTDEEGPFPFPIFGKALIVGRLNRPTAPDSRVSIQGWARYSTSDPPLLFTVELPVIEGAFEGEVPFAKLDLRVAIPGGSPAYVWGAEPDQSGELRLGRLTSTPGSSLSGFLVAWDGRPFSEGTVEIEPLVAAVGAELSRELASLRRRVTTDSQGFFQFAGLEPGRYRLFVLRDGERAELSVTEIGAEEELHLPRVQVEPLLMMKVRVVPPVRLGGGRWTVALLSGREQVRLARASETGEVTFDELTAGNYDVVVTSARGDRLGQEAIALTESHSRELRLDLVEVQGTLKLGGEPLVGQVIVETGRGDSILFRTDDEGRFRGWLRALERRFLRINVRAAVEIERTFEWVGAQVKLEDDVLHLNIDLPATRVHGRVVDGNGRPLPGAIIQVWKSWLPAAEMVADAQGRFTVRGLEHARWWLTARHDHLGAADPVLVELSESHQEIELLLTARNLLQIQGILITPGGLPVRGAQIVVASVGSPYEDFVTTDTRGRFQANVVSGTIAVSTVVLAPSQALWAACLPLFEDHLTIQLPEGAPGTVKIVTRGDLDLPPIEGTIALTSDSGGVLSGDVRAIWGSAIDSTSAGHQVESVAAVSPGWWAASQVDEPSWKFAAEHCSGSMEDGVELELLSPRSELTLEVDLREAQRRRAIGDRRSGSSTGSQR